MSIFERVVAIVAAIYRVAPERLSAETRFLGELGESLEFVEVVLECESTFQIVISDSSAELLVDVGRLVAHIEAALLQKGNLAAAQ